MTDIILASTSTSRRAMLEAAGIAFTTAAPEIDEAPIRDAMIAGGADISAIALSLAEKKARAVSLRHPHALVLGADQILVCDGIVFAKAADEDEVRSALRALRGRTHRLVTAAVIARRGVIVRTVLDEAVLEMRDFSEKFLDTYISAEMPEILGSVGCYRIEAYGAQLFSKISGDQFSIRGLPLLPVLDALRLEGALDS